MLLINLQYDAFERNIDADFGWKEKQNAQKLMIATIEKLANKSTNETSNKTITISLLDDQTKGKEQETQQERNTETQWKLELIF